MKTDHAATPKSNEKKNFSGNNNDSRKRSGMTDSDLTPNPVRKTKATAGRGLANEGTVVNYDEER